MNLKGYLSTLIIVLALFGINWEPASLPNQEIVVEFDSGEVSFDEVQRALAEVKKRLELIGVKNIQVVEQADGRLKITYFSNVDVAAVKQMLSDSHELLISSIAHAGDETPSELPSGGDLFGYELNICEIQNYSNFDLDLSGYLLEPTPDTGSKVVPVDHFVVNEIVFLSKDLVDNVAYAVFNSRALRIDNDSYIIPEVRAGPAFLGIS